MSVNRPPLPDTRTPEDMRRDCEAADLTPSERLDALQNIAARREVVTREAARLDAMEAGHRAALKKGGADV